MDANEPAFQLSRVDLDRPGPHYTMETLTVLREKYPEAEIWFLIGGDSLADLAKWRAPGRIIALARLGVLARPGYAPDLETLSANLAPVDGLVGGGDLRERVDWLQGPALDISSSALRERARRGFSLRFLVPPSVEAYIRDHQLYGVEAKHEI